MTQWRLLLSGKLSAHDNMAIDEAVATAVRKGVSPPTLRFYGWSVPSLTIGYFQDSRRDLLLDACRRDGVPIVRRITGGRAVFHDGDLTYSVAARADDPHFPNDVKGTFRQIAMGLLAGLRRAGIEASLYSPIETEERGRSIAAADCFLSPSWYEITAGGGKLVGSAQRRWPRGFLQQGSLRIQPSTLIPYFKPREERRSRLPEDRMARVTSVEEILHRKVSIQDLVEDLAAGFATTLGVTFSRTGLTPEEDEWASSLAEHKYGTEEWNLERRLAESSRAD